uniref:NADAR domain-containing protein n=1 Tax=Romanomermis culicivorax TaxID=13658 RepID=A0A915ITE6_ROMCU
DINKLEAAKVAPTIKSLKDLHLYIASVVAQCTNDEITSWRCNKMFNTLKVATQLKFAQYTELKALLMQTGNSFLIESNPNDLDWSIGFSLEDLEHWMKDNGVSTYDIACWIFHPEFKPGSIGSNVNGRLLMIMRHEFLAESGLDFRAHSGDAGIL